MEANDYTWLRSQLRRISRRWPPVYKALANAKILTLGTTNARNGGMSVLIVNNCLTVRM